ncbi:Necrosis inducing protein (NPP1) [Streptomyces sp. ADI96-02]|uniref:NPP1 family protein n=1 Tax=unclassified Streptomyces TaxID=2593676 RepID=UPI000F54CDE2|nr:NPP1 family protein [Streptomyces sp. ADI96-02]RPK68816.1 Necrosis inducing protein (NPP1) [Streptomyces sp. ADI96-02]
MRTVSLIRKAPLIVGGALALVVSSAGTALAAPPLALPAQADELERTFQPAYDYDKDGCYPTPGIGPDGTPAPGLNTSGAVNGSCRDASDLANTNGYSRALCNNGWCAVMYELYFEKDQAVAGSGLGGHRHDWEHVIVWVQNGEAQYVSTSAHGGFSTYRRDQIRWEGSHPKIVYHKDGASTHCFRPATAKDDPPENHRGTWQYPALVGWNGYPPGIRDKLVQADFGKANFGLKDGKFTGHLAKAKPSGIAFDPNG